MPGFQLTLCTATAMVLPLSSAHAQFASPAPTVVMPDPLHSQAAGTNLVLYDAVGRPVRAGMRVQF